MAFSREEEEEELSLSLSILEGGLLFCNSCNWPSAGHICCTKYSSVRLMYPTTCPEISYPLSSSNHSTK